MVCLAESRVRTFWCARIFPPFFPIRVLLPVWSWCQWVLISRVTWPLPILPVAPRMPSVASPRPLSIRSSPSGPSRIANIAPSAGQQVKLVGQRGDGDSALCGDRQAGYGAPNRKRRADLEKGPAEHPHSVVGHPVRRATLRVSLRTSSTGSAFRPHASHPSVWVPASLTETISIEMRNIP